MIIPINDKYRIASDSNQWKIENYVGIDKKGNDIWNPKGYYSTLDAARKRLGEMMVMSSDVDNVADALNLISEVKSNLEKAFGIIGDA